MLCMEKSSLKKLTRSDEWWDHKIPQILSLAYATALMNNSSLSELLDNAFLIFFAGFVVVAVYASLINDLTDLEIDTACGKSNLMQRLSPPIRVGLVVLSFSCVIFVAYLIYPRIYSIIFYLGIALSISFYSFPPVRLKNRGIWGVISCAAAEHTFPTLFAVTLFFYYSNLQIEWWWTIMAGLLSFFYGLRSILWHQFLDRENDRVSGINTFASNSNPTVFKFTEKIILLAELFTFFGLFFLLNLWTTYLALGLYLIFILLKQWRFKSKIIIIITPTKQHFQIVMLEFYSVFLPIALLLYCALTQPYGWLALLIHTILFYKVLRLTVLDCYHLSISLIKRMLRR